jgi:hypothetical protein
MSRIWMEAFSSPRKVPTLGSPFDFAQGRLPWGTPRCSTSSGCEKVGWQIQESYWKRSGAPLFVQEGHCI